MGTSPIWILLAAIVMAPIFLLIIGQAAEKDKRWRPLAWIMLGSGEALLGLTAVGALLISLAGPGRFPAQNNAMLALPNINWATMAYDLMATFLGSALLFVTAIRRAIAKVIRIDPQNSVHATALIYTVWLLGLMSWQYGLLRQPQSMSQIKINGWMLWGQALYFTLAGLFGIGFLVRRSPRESWQRLGLTRLHAADWFFIIGGALLMLGLQLFWGLGVQLLAPHSLQQVEVLNDQLLGALYNPWGAFTIGLSAGIGEEILFRGAMQPRFGIFLTSLIFALVHTQYNLAILPLIFLFGIILGLLRQQRSATVAIFTHAIYDSSLLCLALLAQQIH